MTREHPHHLLVGYDGSQASRAALAWAETTARENHARLTLVTVVHRAWCAACWPGMAIAPAQDEIEREAAMQLREAIDALAPDVSVTSRVLTDPVGPALAREALRQDCDLVVIGRGRRLVAPWPSPVERYLRRRCAIPLVVVARSAPASPVVAAEPVVPAAIRPAL